MVAFSHFEKWLEDNISTVSFSKQEMHTIAPVFHYFAAQRSIELDSAHFNAVHSLEKSRLLGITYTPAPIRRRLLDLSFAAFTAQQADFSELTFCDPCCGSGTFAIDAIQNLNQLGVSTVDALNQHIYFSDKDQLSVLLALANLFVWLSQHDIEPERVFPNVSVQDFFKSQQQHDIFVTNPPYIKLQNIEEEDRLFLKDKFKTIFSGSLGTAPIFLYHMQQLLKAHGQIGVITQNNFFTSNSGKKIRQAIGPHLFRIDTFGSQLVFDEVSAYTCLIFCSKQTHTSFIYAKDEVESHISNAVLNPEKWRLGNPEELNFLFKAEHNGQALGQLCDIFVGIATLKDKAYTVFKIDGTWYSKSPDDQLMAIETDLVQPLVKVSDFNDEYELSSNTRGVIYPYQLIEDKLQLIDEATFKDHYPKTYAALFSWKTELMQRSSYLKEKHVWYQWGRNQSMIPVQNKLLTKTFNHGPNFMFDASLSLISNGYGLVPKNPMLSIHLIQRILNSPLFEKYAKLSSYEIDGNYQCYQKNFIEKFTIPLAVLEAQAELLLLSNEEFNLKLTHYYDGMPE